MSVAIVVGHAQSLLTHHVRQATQDRSARSMGRLPASQAMNLVIALPLRNEDQLDQLLKDLYDPSSPSYRQFLTVEQFTEMFSPTQQEYAAALDFAKENGLTVTGTSSNRLTVQVSGSVANVEAAFHVNIGVYQHPTENRTFYAPDREPTTNLTFSLWHVSGLDNYSIPHPAGLDKRSDGAGSSSNATTGSGPSASFLGSDMRAAYYGGTVLTGAGQSVGLLEFYGTDLADLTTYFTNAKQTNNVPITLLSTDGTSTSCLDTTAGGNCDDTEQTLDITQALGMAPGLSSLVMYVGSSDVAIFNAMATANPLNAQLGLSWSWTPADPSTDDPYFKEFAAQGQNLFVAAGDNKMWTTTGKASDVYPADDVYVTSVGGTDLATSSAAGPWASETAWANSGGGISPDNFVIPSWQTAAAAGCASCSQSYRNGPDVSANANYTFYVCADQTTCTANHWGGTSFAAPMWAGYMALINQQSVAKGNKTLGFINPSLYSIGAGSSYTTDFHDITSGSNGYPAATGYDLATGWGSPNGSGLINALAGSLSAATIASPAPGSTLTSASTTFTWNAGPAGTTGYGLNVGTSLGGANLVNIGPLSGTSVTVSLPTNGATIYVRLWTILNGTTYLYNDYTYTEFTQSPAAITSPSPGSALTSASTTFTWNAGPAGTTGYGLNVGTSLGGANLVNIYPLSGTSTTVKLPTNGTTIYVRLWTILNGTTYLSNDYTYTEFSQVASAITSPAPGSTLTSASTTFTWNAGPAGTTGYGLNVGTSLGGANLVNIGPLSGTSVTVKLPTNGTAIYVRLWTELSGNIYLYNDYTYTEAPAENCASPTTIGSFTNCGNFFVHGGTGVDTLTASYSPTAGNGVLVHATWCGHSECAGPFVTTITATISDNVNSPETCFHASPNAPYYMDNSSVPDYPTGYAWYCPSIPAGVTSFTVTTSGTGSSGTTFLTMSGSEWQTGSIAATGYFESVDQGVSSNNTPSLTASVPTSAGITHTNDLIVSSMSNCGGTIDIEPGAGFTALVLNPTNNPGNPGFITEAAAASSSGVQTATATWSGTTTYDNCQLGETGGLDTWYGFITPMVSGH
jgi:kumamolisin